MKIDTTKIEGFDAMTPEEKIAALSSYEFEVEAPNNNAEIEKLKKTINQSNADAAEWKKKYRETLSAQEKEAAEKAEKEAALQAELKNYKDRERVANYTSQLMASGIDAETAKSMAQLLPEGVSPEFFNLTKASHEKTLQTANITAMNTQPKLTPGEPPKGLTEEEKITQALAHAAGVKV